MEEINFNKSVAQPIAHDNTLSHPDPFQFDIAIEGCAHGELDKIYETIRNINNHNGKNIKLLICCGDFQSVRNNGLDLNSMAVPKVYRKLNSFYHYYNGTKQAPCLTLFIGGNHEASEYLWELPYGGWVAPLIYYVGWANVVNFVYEVINENLPSSITNEGNLTRVTPIVAQKVIRIAGLSGIYKWHHYQMGHYECPPFTEDTKRSIYHVRQQELLRLGMIKSTLEDGTPSLDICLSHDWPLRIWEHGQVDQLLAIKPFFAEDIRKGQLGSPPARELLDKLKPKFWFSAHLHVKFPALVVHPPPQNLVQNSSSDDDSVDSPNNSPKNSSKSDRSLSPRGNVTPKLPDLPKKTKFLALDKCLPRRLFLQVIPSSALTSTTQGKCEASYFEIDPDVLGQSHYYTTGEVRDGLKSRCYLAYDEEWLSILKKTDHLLGLSRCPNFLPAEFGDRLGNSHQSDFRSDKNLLGSLAPNPHLIPVEGNVSIPIIPPLGYRGSDPASNIIGERLNSQTTHFCECLGITDPCEAHLLNSKLFKRSNNKPPHPNVVEECGPSDSGINKGQAISDEISSAIGTNNAQALEKTIDSTDSETQTCPDGSDGLSLNGAKLITISSLKLPPPSSDVALTNGLPVHEPLQQNLGSKQPECGNKEVLATEFTKAMPPHKIIKRRNFDMYNNVED